MAFAAIESYTQDCCRWCHRDCEGGEVLDDEVTLDALAGTYKVFQLAQGHRFSTDDLLVSWYARSFAKASSNILDLGSGVGTVSTVLAWNFPNSSIVTIEAQESSVRLARKSVEFNGLGHRVMVRMGDFRDPTCLAPNDAFDLITSSPPYFDLSSGIHSRHPQKLACRFELRGSIHDYCRIAANHLKPEGQFFSVFPVQPEFQKFKLEKAVRDAGLHLRRVRPICLKEGALPMLAVFECRLTPGKSEWEPPLMIRTASGQIHSDYEEAKSLIGFQFGKTPITEFRRPTDLRRSPRSLIDIAQFGSLNLAED